MPHKTPEGPDYFERHGTLIERAADAGVSCGHPGETATSPSETSLYGFGPGILTAAEEAALDAGVHLSENLNGGDFANQSAAFSDFHGSAAHPVAGATLSDTAFVNGRFAVLQSRRPVPAEAEEAA